MGGRELVLAVIHNYVAVRKQGTRIIMPEERTEHPVADILLPMLISRPAFILNGDGHNDWVKGN